MTITLKTGTDVDALRVAGRLASEVLDLLAPHVKPGVTTEELDRIAHHHIVEVQGAVPAPLNYQPPGYTPYPKSVCTSVNHVICHGIPNDQALKDGDILNIDVTVIKDGWHGDTSRMFVVGDGIDRRPRGCASSPTRRCGAASPRCGRARISATSAMRSRPSPRRRLFGGARILRPRHRPALPRGAAGAALRPRRARWSGWCRA